MLRGELTWRGRRRTGEGKGWGQRKAGLNANDMGVARKGTKEVVGASNPLTAWPSLGSAQQGRLCLPSLPSAFPPSRVPRHMTLQLRCPLALPPPPHHPSHTRVTAPAVAHWLKLSRSKWQPCSYDIRSPQSPQESQTEMEDPQGGTQPWVENPPRQL